MKKIFTILAFLSFSVASALAQWPTNDQDYTILGTDSVYGQCQIKTLRTNDGKTILTWLNHPKDIHYSDPNYGYYLYLQIFDANGQPIFEKSGKIISNKSTKSWVTDYGLQLTDNGDLLFSYTDTRNDSNKQVGENYLYRYSQTGQPVWNKDGVKLNSSHNYPSYSDINPLLCVSGNNIYASYVHSEYHKIKADSTNWEPSPWDPDDTMPDSITVSEEAIRITRLNADGSDAWVTPIEFDYNDAWMYPGPEGKLYVVYVNKGFGFSARLIDKDGKDVWNAPATVESGTITSGSFTTQPEVKSDGNGGLVFAYRKLLNFSGYIVTQHLTADGTVYEESLSANGSTDGNGDCPEIAIKDGKVFIAWSYDNTEGTKDLMVNQLSIDGDYTWDGDSLLGYSLDQNEMWGLKAIKVIPQPNGWIVLYGNCQSWNGADFYVCKIREDGKVAWKKQIAESNFKSSGFSVVYDDEKAYIFYTCDKEIGDDWEEIPGPGGMRVMCVDISDATNNICSLIHNEKQPTFYNVQGVRLNNGNQKGLVLIKENGITKKILNR